jgi:hypothetical protein
VAFDGDIKELQAVEQEMIVSRMLNMPKKSKSSLKGRTVGSAKETKPVKFVPKQEARASKGPAHGQIKRGK